MSVENHAPTLALGIELVPFPHELDDGGPGAVRLRVRRQVELPGALYGDGHPGGDQFPVIPLPAGLDDRYAGGERGRRLGVFAEVEVKPCAAVAGADEHELVLRVQRQVSRRQKIAAGIPVIHLVTTYRDVAEIRSNPRWRILADDPASTRKNAERHNLEGSPGCEIMPGLCGPARDTIVDTKKRYDCFVATDLDFVLRARRINTFPITGINTNSCVLCTAAAANVRDYAPIAIEDCVDTMDGEELHHAALACIRTALGWVMSADDALARITS